MSGVTTLDEQIRAVIAHRSDIRLAMVFGSLASGRADRDSDLDLAVYTGRPIESGEKLVLIQLLSEKIGRPVDLIDLATVGEPLLGQIVQYGRIVHGDKTDYAELATRHLVNQADFVPYQNRLLAERRRRWIDR